jgi:hypothetical protein
MPIREIPVIEEALFPIQLSTHPPCGDVEGARSRGRSPHRSCLNLLPSRETPYLAPAAGAITATPLARA